MLRTLLSGLARPSRTRRPSRRLTLNTLEAREVPAAFADGNFVIYRAGDGSVALTGNGSAVFLDEYTPSGTLVQSIALPTTDPDGAGPQHQLIAGGTATAEGLMTRSGNGNYLVFTGYARDLGGATGLAGTAPTAVPRVIALAGANGVVDTTMVISDSTTTGAPRGVATHDGTTLYLSTQNEGIRAATYGQPTSIQLSTSIVTMRYVSVQGGQLYASANSGSFRVGTVGTGLPSTVGQVATNLPGYPASGSPYGFFFADLSADVAGYDTLYVADDAVGIQKYSLVGGNWTANGSAGAGGDAYRGLTGVVMGSTVNLYATRKGSELVSLTDATGYNQTIATAISNPLASAGTNKAFRGIALTPVDMTPVNTLPSAFVSTEDAASLVLTGLAVADGDAGAADVKVTLSVPVGTLTLNTGVTNGLTAGQVTGNGTGTVVVTASLVTINRTLGDATGVTFAAPANANGTVYLSMTTDDLGNTGSGGPRTRMDASPIIIAAVPDDPAITDASTDEDLQTTGGLVFTRNVVDGNEVTHVKVTNITNGTLYLSNGTTPVSNGDFVAYADASAGFKFTPATEFSGTASFQVQASTMADDAGLGGAVRTASITVAGINDAPVNTLPGSFPTTEDNAIALNGISIADADAASGDVVVTLTMPAPAGRLRLTTGITGGVVAGQLTGNDTNAVTITAPLAAINATLADAVGLMYFPTAEYSGDTALEMVTNDQGNTGGAAQSDTDGSTIVVTAVNDAPTATVPSDQSTVEDMVITYTLAGGNQIFVTDVDAGANLKLTLTATNGTLMLGGITGLTNITGWATSELSATGTPAALNAALEGMTYTPDFEFNGPATLRVHVDDQGFTGSGGPLTHFMVNNINVSAVNDVPAINGPGAPTTVPVTEDESFWLAGDFGVNVNDPDSRTGAIFATLTATHGTIVVTDVPSATITGNGTTSITITATVDDLNAALSGLTFTPDADYFGPAAITMTTDDQGNTGGPAETDADTFTINVTSVNDGPELDDAGFNLSGTISVGTVVGTVTATDVENNAISYAIIAGNDDGKFAIDSVTGQITVADPTGLATDYSLTVEATDAGTPPASNTATVTVHINSAPTTVGIPPQVVDEDAATVTLDLATYFTDAEQPAATLTYALVDITNAGLFGSVVGAGNNLALTPAPNAHGQSTITVSATDADGQSVETTFTFTVNPVNDRPVVDTSFFPMLPPIKMPIPRNTFPAGGPIADLIEHVTDADTGDVLGVAITAADSTGKWQYTTNAGVLWADFPALSEATPLKLPEDGQTQIRFIPNKAAKGVKPFPKGFAGLSYRAWDGSNELSSELERGWVAVGKTLPAVNADGNPLLKAVKEDVRQSPAYAVKTFLGLLGKETNPTQVFGIALSATTGTGAWEYNTGKSGWLPLGTVSNTEALLLRTTDRVRFKPAKDFDGDARLTYHTWDQVNGTFGNKVDLATATGVGGPTETAILDILSRNDAPVISAGPSLGSIQAGQTTAAQTVATFLGILATDVDSTGLGIQLLPAVKSVGTWQYKDGTGNWIDVKKATTLTAATEIRFAVAATAKAGLYNLSFKAWDGTPKTPTAFSKLAKATLTITV